MEKTMKGYFAAGLAFVVGIAIVGSAVSRLSAQGTAGAYAIIDISEVSDSQGYRKIIEESPAVTSAFGGRYIVRTDNITSLEGTPPNRLIVIAFDNVAKAQGWFNSPAMKPILEIQRRATKSRFYIVPAI
jgi:uncharacterized protein (DUF1330 family)